MLASHILLNQFSYSTQDHYLRDDTAHHELVPSTSNINKEKVSQAKLVGVFYELRFPRPKLL